MKRLWNAINEMKRNRAVKNGMYLVSRIMISVAAGGAVWIVLGRIFLPGMDWLLCFMGYPGIFAGFFGGIIYLYNHEFETSDLPHFY